MVRSAHGVARYTKIYVRYNILILRIVLSTNPLVSEIVASAVLDAFSLKSEICVIICNVQT